MPCVISGRLCRVSPQCEVRQHRYGGPMVLETDVVTSNIAYYRDEAHKCRSLGMACRDAQQQAQWVGLAESYEMLAQQLEGMQLPHSPPAAVSSTGSTRNS